MKISALILGFNEAVQLPKLFKGIEGVDEIIFIDHESTDKTAEIAKSLGAKVYTREFPYDLVLAEDIKEFTKRFGYAPLFTEEQRMHNAGKERYAGGELASNDWILNIDCDEFVTWDLERVKKKMVDADVVNCKFVHIQNPDGTPEKWYQLPKLYRKSKTWWIGRIHEGLTGYNLRVAWTDDMVINHRQRPREYRTSYIANLEYAVLQDGDMRSFYYLGKEYWHHAHYEKAITFLTLYLKEATYIPEKIHAHLLIAQCLSFLGREDEAWVYATQALRYNPSSKEAYVLLSQLSGKKDAQVWLRHAALGEEEHLV